ncbi:MAG: hypothetical protein LBR76_05185 [Oscillospiraceae bacterium]|nr:hypothetical protein [Oscillospiraceae bacterium]
MAVCFFCEQYDDVNDIYALLFPHIFEAVDALSDGILLAATPDETARLSDEALRRSGLLHCLPCQASGALMALALAVTEELIQRRLFAGR